MLNKYKLYELCYINYVNICFIFFVRKIENKVD